MLVVDATATYGTIVVGHRADGPCAAAAADARGAARLDAGADGDPPEVPGRRRQVRSRPCWSSCRSGCARSKAVARSGADPLRGGHACGGAPARGDDPPRSRARRSGHCDRRRHRQRRRRRNLPRVPRERADARRLRSQRCGGRSARGRVTLSSRRLPTCRRRMALARCRRGPPPGGDSLMAPARTAVYLYCLVARRAAARGPARAGGLPGGIVPNDVRGRRPLPRHRGRCPWMCMGPGALERAARRSRTGCRRSPSRTKRWSSIFARRRRVTVVPMKLFTMFSSMDKAVAEFAAGATAIERAMRRIAGCEEWGVRITRAPAGQSPGIVQRSRPSRSPRPARRFSGRGRQRATMRRHRAHNRWRRGSGPRGLRAPRARCTPARAASGERGSNPPLLEAAFLVTSGAGPASRRPHGARARMRGGRGDLTLTGPWPAYNFVGTPEEES